MHMSSQAAPHTARITAHLSPRMTASARTTHAWLRKGRVCTALAGLLLLSTVALAVIHRTSPLRLPKNPLAAEPAHPMRLWSLLTAWTGTIHLSPFVGVVVLLTVGIAIERFIGSRSFLISAFVSHAVGIGAALVAHPLITAVAPGWGHAMTRHPISGIPLLLLGPVMASTALMNHLWCRRTRVLVLGFLLVETAVTGTPGALARLGAATTGLFVGMITWRGSVSSARLSRTRRTSRNLLALVVACWSLMLALAAVSRAAFGPLASARYGVFPEREVVHPVTGALGLSLMGSAGCSSRSSGSNYIAIITPAHDNPFFKTQAEAAVAAATAMGYTANSFSHGDDVNKQSELFDSAISQGAAAIICDNAGADSTEGAVRKAVEVGIPVFLIDREINASGLATAQIVANNSQGAALVAAKLADTLQGKGRYYELLGRETDTNAQVRSTAFHSVLDQYPGFELVATETANWDQQIGYQKVETLLQRDANVQAIICGNDTMAVGAVAAVQQAGKTGDILVIGFDGSPDAVKAIQGGSMLATGMQPAVDIAKMAVEQADAYIKNGETGKKEKQLVDCVLIDKSNADRYTLFEMKES